MSGMLVHYAATGNPNHPGLPAWPAYDLNGRNTMIWDNPPHIERDPRGQERRYAAGSPYRQPGTY
jgi:para-nitrobenzyl esterase